MGHRNTDLVPGFPACRLFGLLDTGADVQAALLMLSPHVHPATVTLLHGERGIRALDISGRARGVRGRMLRAIQDVAFDRSRLEQHEAHLRRGGYLLLIPARDWEQCQRLVEALTRSGAPGAIRAAGGGVRGALRRTR